MCGITGIAGENVERGSELIRKMTKTLSHRGPDDEDYFIGKGVFLGHRRLSFIDLESGRQPLSNED